MATTAQKTTITQGKTFTDTQGKTQVAQFNPNTGQKLSAGQAVSVNPIVGSSTGGGSQPTTYYYGKDAKGNPVYESSSPGTAAQSTPTLPTNQTTPETQAQTSAKTNLQTANAEASNLPGSPGSLMIEGNPNVKGGISATSPYQAGAKVLSQSGTPAPSDRSAAGPIVKGTLPPPPEDTSVVDSYISTDPGITELMKGITELLNPQVQTTSILDDYKQLYKESGLDQINHEIIDAETVINGTEQDIRNEIQTAGGFGTESQVQAMALSRNKSLLTRYNQLVQMKTDATNQLNTMSQLSIQDKQMAQKKIDTQIGAMFNMADFAQKAQNNTQEQYKWLTEKMGADGVYNAYKNDPRQLGFLEKSLGLAPGGLKPLAVQSAYERVRKEDADMLDRRYKEAQIRNVNSEITKHEYDMTPVNGIDEKTMTKLQAAPEYKTISAVIPALTALKAYKDAVEKWGTTETLSGTGKGELQGTYGNALAAWKTLAGLGALSGADFGLAENAVPAPTFFARKSTQTAKVQSSLNAGLNQAEAMTKRLVQNYPAAAQLLNSQLSDIKISTDPSSVVSSKDVQAMDQLLK